MAKKQFKAESKRLLDLMINSIYTHEEIFLREAISNASDAVDKLYYKAMMDPSSRLDRSELRIDVKPDRAARTVTVSDNGIGMTREELEENLGVIAHSGSLDFKAELHEGADSKIIGQFGVGFYSAFMVSDSVTVVTRAYGSDAAYRWRSDGADGYTIEECEKEGVGTDVIMHLKPDAEGQEYSAYLETYRLQDLVKTYSDYVRWPIHMEVQSGKWEETGEKDEQGKPKKEYVTTVEDKVINSMVPIWQRGRDDATDEECAEFYKAKFRDGADPISVIRANAEGIVSYRAMLFVPSKAPYDFYTRDFKPGLQLYSSGVMIMDKCDDLLPYCFRFVRGVVDSPDFSLNISREVLQHDRQLRSVASNLTKKVKSELLRLMKDEPEKYKEFYGSFGRQLKYGTVEEYGTNRDLMVDLLMFHSMKEGGLVSLQSYVDAMPEGQDRIYFVSADTVEHAGELPQTEQVKAKGYDILCLAEDIDEFVMKTVGEFDGKKLCNLSTDDVGIESEDERKEAERQAEESKEVLEFAKKALEGKVGDVRISRRLKSSAVILTSDGSITLEMEKYFQSLPGTRGDEQMKAERVLELNPSHPAFAALKAAVAGDEKKAEKMVRIMYDQACIIAGMPVDDAVGSSELVFGLF